MSIAQRRSARVLLLTAWLAAVSAGRAAAQAPDRAIEFEDLGLDAPLDASARGLALSAFAATANDATALAYNPAGLARVKRISGVATLAGRHSTFDFSYGGDARVADLDEVALHFVGVAFPLPVLRGSLVPAVGVQRLFTSSLELSYQGFNAPDVRNDRVTLQQTGATYAYRVGAGIDLSAAFSLGAEVIVLDGGVDRVRQYDTRGLVVDPNVHTFVYEDTDADVDGYGACLGFQFYAFEALQLGVSLTTPVVFEVEATTVTEETRQVDNDTGTFTLETTNTTTEYKIPYRIEGALAAPVSPALLFAFQAGYTDWSQATIDDQRLITTALESVLRPVLELRGGVEWTLARWPLRVRAGVLHRRRAAAFLQSDRIDNDRLQRVDTESATLRYSLGAGCLVRGSIGIDVAAAHTRGERASSTIGDTRETTTVSISLGYWF